MLKISLFHDFFLITNLRNSDKEKEIKNFLQTFANTKLSFIVATVNKQKFFIVRFRLKGQWVAGKYPLFFIGKFVLVKKKITCKFKHYGVWKNFGNDIFLISSRW
jgi:hypothetical protein